MQMSNESLKLLPDDVRKSVETFAKHIAETFANDNRTAASLYESEFFETLRRAVCNKLESLKG